MSALFPWWMNSAARATLLAAVVIAIVAPLAAMVWVRSSPSTGQRTRVAQPIPFDHRVHAHSLHIDCLFCHSTATEAANAGVPPTTACVGCHAKSLQDSRTFAPVRASLASRRPIAWQRVNALPDFVFFDHSIHIAKGVGCETCHGRVDRMSQVSQATPMSMGWCVGCHRDPRSNLRPRRAVTAMGWRDSSAAAESSGVALMRAHGVRPLTNCSTCHR